MGIRNLTGGAVLLVAIAGSLLTGGTAAAATPAECASDTAGTAAACTPYWKQDQGISTKTSCDWAGSSGAQAFRWTGWKCTQALGGWELWVRDCSSLAETPEAVALRETV